MRLHFLKIDFREGGGFLLAIFVKTGYNTSTHQKRRNTVDKRLERILPRVQKPARYTGGEYNAVMKDKSGVDTRFAFCFPDTYEIGWTYRSIADTHRHS